MVIVYRSKSFYSPTYTYFYDYRFVAYGNRKTSLVTFNFLYHTFCEHIVANRCPTLYCVMENNLCLFIIVMCDERENYWQ